VLHVSGLLRRLPFAIKDTGRAAGRRFDDDLALRCDGGAQSGERLVGPAGPARDLAQMQPLDSQSAAGIEVSCALNAVFAVEVRKDDLPDV
jgi:hypothetical protein